MGTILHLLTMFGPLAGAKFWVAAIMALLQFLNIYSGIDIGLDEATVTAVIGGIGALLVWLVPNGRKDKLPVYTREEALRYNNAATGNNQTRIPTYE